MNRYRILYQLVGDETTYTAIVSAPSAWESQDAFYEGLKPEDRADVRVLQVERAY